MIICKCFRSNLSKTRIILVIIISALIYNEYIAYSLKKWFSWPTIHCSTSSKCIKILLVADPQILGEQYEVYFPRGLISRWDSDRYIYKVFQKAVSHVDPHVVVFLGDIMDEGSVATDDEFKRYIERFHNVFRVNHRAKFVFLPGDNDIGGETEPLSIRKMKMFQETFKQPDVMHLGHIDMFKVVTQIRPHAIFSAHDHKSRHISADAETGERILAEMLTPSAGPVWQYQLNSGLVHELMVPTCSYRMGVSNMGFGAAVIDGNTDTMLYAVLWLPSRFWQLYMYIITLSMICMFIILILCKHVWFRIRHKLRRRASNTKHAV